MTDVEYEVRLAGFPTDAWPLWFPAVTMERAAGDDGAVATVLRVPGRDASLLHGVLAQIGALNLTLLSVLKQDSQKTP